MVTRHGSNVWPFRCVCVAALLLLILAEIMAAVLTFGLERFHPEMPLNSGSTTPVNAVLHVCLLAPVVLLSFACLSLLLAAHGRDETAVRASAALQAAAWLSVLIGLAGYLFVALCCASREGVASWFYVYAAVEVELAVTVFLTDDTRRKVSPDGATRPEKALEL